MRTNALFSDLCVPFPEFHVGRVTFDDTNYILKNFPDSVGVRSILAWVHNEPQLQPGFNALISDVRIVSSAECFVGRSVWSYEWKHFCDCFKLSLRQKRIYRHHRTVLYRCVPTACQKSVTEKILTLEKIAWKPSLIFLFILGNGLSNN